MTKVTINILLFILIGLSSCGNKSSLNKTLSVAGANRVELLKVIEHYRSQNNNDTLKLKAALFLVENMFGHFTVRSSAIDSYSSYLQQSDTLVRIETLNRWWKELKVNHKPRKVYDACVLTADFLIQDIDKAFDVWYSSSWKNEIDFNAFCQYILPYRFQCELLAEGWRDSLYNEYYPLIADTKDIKDAFSIIYKTVLHQMGRGKMSFPYVVNVLDMKHQLKATCMQRCVYIGSVLRSVGIPASIDIVNQWANYSQNGHAWISLPTNEGTYTIAANDSVPKLKNEIDASLFPLTHRAEEDYQLLTDFKKRTAKVVRLTYKYNDTPQDVDTDQRALYLLANPFSEDVSKEYNLTGTIDIKAVQSVEHAYLCTFATGRDWRPVSYAEQKDAHYIFSNMGDSIVYLPVVYNNGKMLPIDNPFLSVNSKKKYFQPCLSETQRIVLTRKYPLIGSYINNWGTVIGARFEGSNQPDFKQKDVLCTVNKTPMFRNEIKLESGKAYRYLRYVSTKNDKSPISELEFWADDVLLRGTPFSENATKVERCFDDETFKILTPQKNGYVVGIDFGKPYVLSRIVYYLKNDDNFVIPNNDYELFYYDMKWNSLGKQKTDGFELIYDNAPTNAIFLLKNYTKGIEERIFTYENGKQVWW